MGITLTDLHSDQVVFDINFWHWRAIVEAIRRTGALPADRVDALHEPCIGELTLTEARAVATALRTQVLSTLGEAERLLIDGARTMEPDDGTFHRAPEDQHRNYSTDRGVLERFVVCCETCGGFVVTP